MRNSHLSRRDFTLLCGLGFIGTGLNFANVRRVVAAPVFPAVGRIAVVNVAIKPNPVGVGPPAIATDRGFCKLQSGGITFQTEIEFRDLKGPPPAWRGELTILQNVHFKHRRTATNGKRTCSASTSKDWDLDGQYPYKPAQLCKPGMNVIDHHDDPGVFTEEPNPPPYETVEVEPMDLFRTYVIWEITANNQQPSPRNPAQRQYLARVDWTWKGVAMPPSPNRPAQCRSGPYAPNEWGLENSGSSARIFVGSAALTAGTPPFGSVPPRFKPAAQPNVWTPC